MGEDNPVTSCPATASHRVTQAVRRQERLSHGAPMTTPAVAAASAGLAVDGPSSHGQPLALAVRALGRSPPAKCVITISTAMAAAAPPARLASNRNRR